MRELLQPVSLLRLTGVLAFGLGACDALLIRLTSPPATPVSLLEYLTAQHMPKDMFWVVEQGCIWALAALLWRGTRPEAVGRTDPGSICLVGLQVIVASLSAGDLLPLVAVQVGLLMPGRKGLLWLLGQMILQMCVCLFLPATTSWLRPLNGSSIVDPHDPALALFRIPVYHLLGYSLGLLGAVESRQREELGMVHEQVLAANRELRLVNAELQATQQMEAEAARMAERLTIARELHDALGHHLAGLSVNLQLATKLEGMESKKAVQEAYVLARMLLSDVRTVVTDLRQLGALDLRDALSKMAGNIAAPKVLLDFDEELEDVEPVSGHTLFRCAQEAITNAVRHSDAKHLWLQVSKAPGGYLLTARDDGRGSRQLEFGNGLTGMKERVEQLGGTMVCETGLDAGFYLEIRMPAKAPTPC